MTDNSQYIAELRERGDEAAAMVANILEMHDITGISLVDYVARNLEAWEARQKDNA